MDWGRQMLIQRYKGDHLAGEYDISDGTMSYCQANCYLPSINSEYPVLLSVFVDL
jgi:hypothetical protein